MNEKQLFIGLILFVINSQVSDIPTQARDLIQYTHPDRFIDFESIRYREPYALFSIRSVIDEHNTEYEYYSVRCSESGTDYGSMYRHSRYEWDNMEEIILSGLFEEDLLSRPVVSVGLRTSPFGETVYSLICDRYVTGDSSGFWYFIKLDSIKKDGSKYWFFVERRPQQHLPSKEHMLLYWSIDCKAHETNNHILSYMQEIEHLLFVAKPIEEKVNDIFVDLVCNSKLTINYARDDMHFSIPEN